MCDYVTTRGKNAGKKCGRTTKKSAEIYGEDSHCASYCLAHARRAEHQGTCAICGKTLWRRRGGSSLCFKCNPYGDLDAHILRPVLEARQRLLRWRETLVVAPHAEADGRLTSKKTPGTETKKPDGQAPPLQQHVVASQHPSGLPEPNLQPQQP